MASTQRALNKKLSQLFRMRGLSVRPDALQPLYGALQGDEDWENTLQALLVEVQQQNLKAGQVDAVAVKLAISNLRSRTTQRPTLSLEVVSAFGMQPLRFDSQRRALVAQHSPTSLHAPASSKSSMYTLRLAMVEQRTRRHDMFRAPVLAHGIAPKEHIQLASIDSLVGRSGTRVVLGMLAELEEGVFYLEDGHGAIALDLSEAAMTAGLFTRHSIVLAEGEVLPSGVFLVQQLGLPPPEPRSRSIASLGNLDPLHAAGDKSGSPSSVMSASAHSATTSVSPYSTSGAARSAADQVAMQNSMLIVLSDVWLDDASVMRKLGEMLRGYEQVGAQQVGSGRTAAPLASFFTFVLCGNFASASHAAATANATALKALFRGLASLVAKTPVLARHARFVLVAGPDDPSLSAPGVLPRAALPRSLCSELLDAAQHVELATSPARLVLHGQVVVVHREELLVKARRACVLPPSNDASITSLNQHLLKTLIDGAHLCPLPPEEAAVYWENDHAMWLHPSPDVLVLADRQHQFQHTYEETLAFNPGSFSTDGSWTVYRPSSKEAEASSLA